MKIVKKQSLADAGSVSDLTHGTFPVTVLRKNMKASIQDRLLLLLSQRKEFWIHPAPPLTVSVNVILNPLTVFEKTPKSSVPAQLQHVLTADKAVCDLGIHTIDDPKTRRKYYHVRREHFFSYLLDVVLLDTWSFISTGNTPCAGMNICMAHIDHLTGMSCFPFLCKFRQSTAA